MAIPLAAITALAQFAPTLFRFLGVGSDSAPAQIADKVAEVAQQVSGAKTIDEAITVFASSTEKAWEFKLRMLSMDREFEQLYLADVQSARGRDKEFIKAGQINHRANWMTIFAFLIVCFLFFAVWRDPDINEFAKGVVTLILGRFLGYLDGIYNFEFGSTRSSKTKDDTIHFLSEKK